MLTTQYLDEADELADRIAVLDQGKLVAEGTPDELKRLIPGGHIRLQFADASGLESAARALNEGARDDNELTLQVPTDGSVRSLRAVLDLLDNQSIVANGLSIHTPNLDDVFFAITGRPKHRKALYDEHPFLYPQRFGDDATARYPALAAQPLDTVSGVLTRYHDGAVHLHLRRHARRWPWRRSARAYINYVAPAILIMTIGSGCATTAVNLCTDMSEGIIARFRTMAISRTSVLTGLVIGSLIRTMISIVLVIGHAAHGLPPDEDSSPGSRRSASSRCSPWDHMDGGGVWPDRQNACGRQWLSLIFVLILPYTSSAFVRPDSMPAGIRWFAEYQPFTPSLIRCGDYCGYADRQQRDTRNRLVRRPDPVGYLAAQAIYNRNSVAYNFSSLR